jgi:hypothetical protein
MRQISILWFIKLLAAGIVVLLLQPEVPDKWEVFRPSEKEIAAMAPADRLKLQKQDYQRAKDKLRAEKYSRIGAILVISGIVFTCSRLIADGMAARRQSDN